MRRRPFGAALAGLFALALPAPGAAALEVRLTVVPTSPRAGETATLEAQLYWPRLRRDGTCCRLERARTAYPLRVEASSARGRVFRVRLRPVAGRDGLWRARITFGAPGRWELRATNWGPRYAHAPGARPLLRVRVRRAR